MGQTARMAKTSVMVVDSDELARRALGRTVTAQGFELAGEATTAVEALRLLEHTPADVVVITNELQGLRGVDVTAELTAAGRRVVVLTSDPLAQSMARKQGAFASIPRGDLGAFEHVLAGIAPESAEGDRRSGVDRRAGMDRRVSQDWSKVIRERRTGAERREADRRTSTSAATG